MLTTEAQSQTPLLITWLITNAAVKIDAQFTDVLSRITKFYLNFGILLGHESLLHIFFAKFVKIDSKPLDSVTEAADGTT